jgi:hypothetical protein
MVDRQADQGRHSRPKACLDLLFVIASEAKQSRAKGREAGLTALDCFVALLLAITLLDSSPKAA